MGSLLSNRDSCCKGCAARGQEGGVRRRALKFEGELRSSKELSKLEADFEVRGEVRERARRVEKRL